MVAHIKEFETRGITVALVNADGQPYKRPVLVFPAGTFKNHGRFPVRLSVDKAIADTIKPEVLYRGTIEQGEASKAEPKYDTDYYWTVLEIGPTAGSPAPVATAAKPQDGPQASRSGPPEPQAEAPPWDEEQQASRRDPRNTSIERQTALKAANHYACVWLQEKKEALASERVRDIYRFYVRLLQQPIPPEPQQPAQAPAAKE